MYSRLIFLALQTLKTNIKWLEDCCTYIESLPKQRQVCFLSKPTFGALRITLHSTVALIDRLLKSGFCYVLVGNLGQDPLERFFGIARHVAGDGGQPTVQQFLFMCRMLSVNNLVRPPKRASVDGSGPQLLLTLQGLFDKEKPSTTQVFCNLCPVCVLKFPFYHLENSGSCAHFRWTH